MATGPNGKRFYVMMTSNATKAARDILCKIIETCAVEEVVIEPPNSNKYFEFNQTQIKKAVSAILKM